MEVAAARPTRSLSRRAVGIAIAFLVLVAVALSVVGGVFAFRANAAEQEQARRQAILHASRQEAINLMSLSYKTLDSDIQHILDGATGQLEKQFSKHAKQLHTVVPKVKAVTTGEVLSAGIVNADKDSAKVLLVVDQTVKNKTQGKSGKGQGKSGNGGKSDGILKHYRMSMTLQHQEGRWLVSKLEFL